MGALAVLSIPLAILNMLAGVVAFVWLLFAGQWRLLVTALIAMLVGGFVIPLTFGVSMLFVMAGAVALRRGWHALMLLCSTLANLWVVLVTMVWQVLVFFYFGRFGQGSLALPVWLLSYAVATGVFTWMARKSQTGGEPGLQAFHAFAAQLAYIVFSICVLFLRLTPRPAFTIMAAVMVLPVIVGVSVARRSSPAS